LYCYKCSAELKGQHPSCWNCGAIFGRERARSPTTLPRGRFQPRRVAAAPSAELQVVRWIFRAACGLPWLLSGIALLLLVTSASGTEITSFASFGLLSLGMATFIFFARRDWMFYIVIALGIGGWVGLFWIFFGTPLTGAAR
jgi:hypothetical protein